MGTNIFAQNNTCLKVLEGQIQAFNNADIERLVDNIDENFKWYYVSPYTMILEVAGKEQFRKSMVSYYKYFPGVSSKVDQTVVTGNKISFEETVSWQGKNGPKSQACIGVYEIKGDKIYRAWYFIE